MKKSTVLALVAILGFGCTSAQKNGVRRQMSVPQQVNKLKKELKLTDEQTENITVLYTDFKKKNEVCRRELTRTDEQQSKRA